MNILSQEFTDDFFGIFQVDVDCESYINYFNHLYDSGFIVSRATSDRNDKQFFLHENMIMEFSTNNSEHLKQFNSLVGECFIEYAEEYTYFKDKEVNQHFAKIQKTLPGEGFHSWHCENDTIENGKRLLGTMLYLNDVEDGGETEFLYQHKRFKPEAGKLLIWPAAWTHLHRGNPPLKGEKYIITSWIEK